MIEAQRAGRTVWRLLAIDRPRSLVLTGFTATGKTSTGKIVAARLSREFADMDEIIGYREGRSVRALYAAQGEAYLRAIESELCAELALCGGLVIATGGGASIRAQNLSRFSGAFVVCLEASPEAILARMGDVSDRPLFRGADAGERVQALYDARRQAYARMAVHVDTSSRTVKQVADQVIALDMEGGK